MDSYQNLQKPQTTNFGKRSQFFALASTILGVISIVTCGCLYLSLAFGSLGILFALLSKGGETTLDTQGVTGLILSSIGFTLTLCFYLISFLFLLYYYGGIDAFLQQYGELSNAESVYELYDRLNAIQPM